MNGMPVSNEYMNWYITQLRAREQAERSARRLASDFLVFVSYAWADAAAAHEVTDVLERRNVRYIQDRKDISWGKGISGWADDEITRSTHYLLILSRSSSISSWCAFEYGVAVGRGKEILVYITDRDLNIPHFAAGRAAVRELRDVESFFKSSRIDMNEVDRFICDILEISISEIGAFVARGVGESLAWDAPDRVEKEQEIHEIKGWTAGVNLDGLPRTLGLELDLENARLVVEAKTGGYKTVPYELSYAYEVTAVRVTPQKAGCFVIGVMDDSEPDPHLRKGSGTVQDAISGKRAYGWSASFDFWARTLDRIAELKSSSGPAGTGVETVGDAAVVDL